MSDDGQGSRKGPLEEGSDFGDQHPDPYMHDDPYVVRSSDLIHSISELSVS